MTTRPNFLRLLPAWAAMVMVLLSGVAAVAAEPKVELLWPQGAPGAKGDQPADRPTLTVYLPEPDKATGAAVIVCPGGGYGGLAISYEGHDFARWFNTLGVAGFVCDYRHRGKGYGHPAPLEDAQRAIRMVRARAAEWKIDPAKIGIIGFSAGGHLASTTGTHFDAGDAKADDPIQRVSSRPDFMILCYPVITTSKPFGDEGSFKNLLGENPDPELLHRLSTETQVKPDTPPTFLFHTDGDKGVAAENSILFYQALRAAKVPAELHIYRTGRHGLGLAQKEPGACNWPKQCEDWMRGLGLLGK